MSRKQAVFVLGMHRSGTSTVSNFITSLGYDLGHHPMAPREDNPKGFWENTEITRVNDEILALHGLRWDSLTLIQDLPIESICNDKQIRSKVLQVLGEEFDTDKISIKDPRMCHLLPLWKSVLNEVNYETHYITVNRDPAAVAQSLAKRDMMSFERGLLLWLLYSVSMARYIAGSSAIAIDYDELMKSPASSLSPLKLLNPDGFADQVAKFIAEFLSESLYHHSPEETINPLARYALSIKEALGKSEDPKRLEAINGQLQALLQMYSYREVNESSTSLYNELSETKAHAARLDIERQRYDDYVLDLSRQIDEQTDLSDSLKDETLTLNRNINKKDTYIESMESSVAAIRAALQEKDEYAISLIQTVEVITNDRDKLREALSEKSSSSDEYIQSLLSTLDAKEAYLISIDAKLETSRSVIKTLEVDSQSNDDFIAMLSADLVKMQQYIKKLERNTLIKRHRNRKRTFLEELGSK